MMMLNFNIPAGVLVLFAIIFVAMVASGFRWKLARRREERSRQLFLKLLQLQQQQDDDWMVK